MSASERVAFHVAAARRANHLALRFARKGDSFNYRQARTLAIRAMLTARDIKKGN